MKVSETSLITASILLRIAFFGYGLFQDATMDVKYTDIDYLVFSDAAYYVSLGSSPYNRETYRYTPLLAWLMLPNSIGGVWYSFGKVLFMLADLLTGLIIIKILKLVKMEETKRLLLSSIWLLNPMVITISTRGSSESLLTVFIISFIYFMLRKKYFVSGCLLGLSIHFKIYPVVYLPTAILFIANQTNPQPNHESFNLFKLIFKCFNRNSIVFLIATILTFSGLTVVMYLKYNYEFIYHTYLYHFVRSDHRHNFSIYNLILYFNSSLKQFESLTKLAFLPQLTISAVLLPLTYYKTPCDCFFLQTFAFVFFNKVITSQYFIWFLVFLPIYLRNSTFTSTKKLKGVLLLAAWIFSQSIWLLFAYKLEFLGENTFFPQLFYSSCFFFITNVFILGEFIEDMNYKSIDGI